MPRGGQPVQKNVPNCFLSLLGILLIDIIAGNVIGALYVASLKKWDFNRLNHEDVDEALNISQVEQEARRTSVELGRRVLYVHLMKISIDAS